jgi:hypothetical protein
MFHTSASVSRWEKDRDGKHERATIAGIRASRGEGEQGVMANECETLDSNGQGGADAQAIDPLYPRFCNERCWRYYIGRREHYIISSAPLVVGLAFHHLAGGGFPASDDDEKARVEHEAQYE